MASLLGELQESGSRLSDGSPNAGGKCWFYQPGTTTPVNVYTDAGLTAIATQPVVLDLGGRIPPADYPDGIWLTRKVRLYVEDSGGGVVSDTTYTPADANNSNLTSDYYTSSTVKGALESIASSVGGTNGEYLQSLGATPRTVHDKFEEIWISVKDHGAVGDGVAIDTTGIQAAVNAVIALGGGVVYFPFGTYKIDQAIVADSTTGVSLVGVPGATTIISTNAAVNVLTLSTSSTFCTIDGLTFSHSTASAGAAIAAVAPARLTVTRTIVTGGDFAYGIQLTGASASFSVEKSAITGNTRAIDVNTVGASVYSTIFNSTVSGVLAPAIELNGGFGDLTIFGGLLGGTEGIRFNAAYTGGVINVFGTRNLATTAYNVLGATDPNLRRWGDGIDGYVTSQASGGGGGSNFTPNRSAGSDIHLRLTSGGAAVCTINAAIPAPSATMRGITMKLRLTAAAGGAITWTFDPVYVLVGGAATIAGADGTTTIVSFEWDVQTSEWREQFRSATAT